MVSPVYNGKEEKKQRTKKSKRTRVPLVAARRTRANRAKKKKPIVVPSSEDPLSFRVEASPPRPCIFACTCVWLSDRDNRELRNRTREERDSTGDTRGRFWHVDDVIIYAHFLSSYTRTGIIWTRVLHSRDGSHSIGNARLYTRLSLISVREIFIDDIEMWSFLFFPFFLLTRNAQKSEGLSLILQTFFRLVSLTFRRSNVWTSKAQGKRIDVDDERNLSLARHAAGSPGCANLHFCKYRPLNLALDYRASVGVRDSPIEIGGSI